MDPDAEEDYKKLSEEGQEGFMADEDTGASLLEDITSEDPRRIWSSSCAIVRLRDPQILAPLADHLEEIRAKTDGIELGGALFPNSEHLKVALHKLEYCKYKRGCYCRLYPEYLFYDPQKEEKDGNIRIRETKELNGGWTTYYLCECTICGTRYRVEQGESHYTWWQWRKMQMGESLIL